MKTVEESILEMHKKGGNTRLTMGLLKQLRNQEQKATDTVYEFFREHLKDDQKMMDYARNHYERYLKNDPDYPTFEDWFKDCVYDMSGKCWKEGVESWLGELKHKDEFDQYLKDIKFQDFLDNLDYKCEVHFVYSDGRYPGDVYSMLADPTVHISVKFLERSLAYGK